MKVRLRVKEDDGDDAGDAGDEENAKLKWLGRRWHKVGDWEASVINIKEIDRHAGRK